MWRERNDSENLNCWTLKLIVNRIHFIVTLIAKVIFSNICLLKTNSVTGWCIETVTQTEDYSTLVRNCLNSKLFFFLFISHDSFFCFWKILSNSNVKHPLWLYWVVYMCVLSVDIEFVSVFQTIFFMRWSCTLIRLVDDDDDNDDFHKTHFMYIQECYKTFMLITLWDFISFFFSKL